MSETNKIMSSLLFPNTDQPYQVQDPRIPKNPGTYKYMATDGEGNWIPADRLAYKTVEMTNELTYDGNPTSVAAGTDPMLYYRISESTPSSDTMIGGTLTMYNPNYGEQETSIDSEAVEDYGTYYRISDFAIFVTVSGTTKLVSFFPRAY